MSLATRKPGIDAARLERLMEDVSRAVLEGDRRGYIEAMRSVRAVMREARKREIRTKARV